MTMRCIIVLLLVGSVHATGGKTAATAAPTSPPSPTPAPAPSPASTPAPTSSGSGSSQSWNWNGDTAFRAFVNSTTGDLHVSFLECGLGNAQGITDITYDVYIDSGAAIVGCHNEDNNGWHNFNKWSDDISWGSTQTTLPKGQGGCLSGTLIVELNAQSLNATAESDCALKQLECTTQCESQGNPNKIATCKEKCKWAPFPLVVRWTGIRLDTSTYNTYKPLIWPNQAALHDPPADDPTLNQEQICGFMERAIKKGFQNQAFYQEFKTTYLSNCTCANANNTQFGTYVMARGDNNVYGDEYYNCHENICGDGICDFAYGEDLLNCEADCVVTGSPTPWVPTPSPTPAPTPTCLVSGTQPCDANTYCCSGVGNCNFSRNKCR